MAVPWYAQQSGSTPERLKPLKPPSSPWNWIEGMKARRPPLSPERTFPKYNEAMEGQRREYENQQGDSIRGQYKGLPLNSRPPSKRIPQVAPPSTWRAAGTPTEQAPPDASRRLRTPPPTETGVMSVPLAQQVAPFILALLDAARGPAQPASTSQPLPQQRMNRGRTTTQGGF